MAVCDPLNFVAPLVGDDEFREKLLDVVYMVEGRLGSRYTWLVYRAVWDQSP